jgi:DNA-binding CsgD family transcriptional regulator
VSTLETARAAMTAELAAAFVEQDCLRVEAAATWLRAIGVPLVDVYEVLLEAALRREPYYAGTPAEHVRAYELQECVRDLVARLAPRQRPGTRGQVVVIVPGGSRWVLGTAALTHVLEDAGFSTVSSPDLELHDIEPILAGLDNPVGLCVAVHDVTGIPALREVVKRVRAAYPRVRVVVGGKASTAVSDLAGLTGAHVATTSLRQTLAELGEGSNPLSPRELAVLRCVARGMSNPDAGQHLGVAPATVKTHLDRVFAKLGTSDRTATVALAMRRGWIE